MLKTGYIMLNYAEVPKPAELFRDMGNNTDTAKVRSMFDSSKAIFGINSIRMMVAQEDKIYRYTVLSDKGKFGIAELYYIPAQRRLDVWVLGEQLPLLQFKGKSIVHKNYSEFYDKLGIDKLFSRLIANL